MWKSLVLVSALCLLAAGPAQAAPRYYYGDDCRAQNRTTGTLLGAILGGILGNQFGRGGGNVAATLGGVILGGVAGNAIAGDIDCQDRPYAFQAYAEGFSGPIGRSYEWHNERRTSRGSFVPMREYHDRGLVCRDFREDRYVRGRQFNRTGTACREGDGNWHFR